MTDIIYNRALSEQIQAAFSLADNVRIIDCTRFADRKDCFLDTSNHFTKQVYYALSQEYARLITEWCGSEVERKPEGYVAIYDFKDRIKNALRKNKALVRIKRKIGGVMK